MVMCINNATIGKMPKTTGLMEYSPSPGAGGACFHCTGAAGPAGLQPPEAGSERGQWSGALFSGKKI